VYLGVAREFCQLGSQFLTHCLLQISMPQ
jgi:hypothetical protein